MNSYEWFVQQLAKLNAEAMVTQDGVLQIETVSLPDQFDLPLNNAAYDGAIVPDESDCHDCKLDTKGFCDCKPE